MKKVYGFILVLLLFTIGVKAQTFPTGTDVTITSSTTFSGVGMWGSYTLTIKSGAVVTFTGGVSLENSYKVIIEPGAKLIILSGGLTIKSTASLTSQGALSVRGGGLTVQENGKLSLTGINKDTIIGNAQFISNASTEIGAGTDLYINGNVTSQENASFKVDGNMQVNGTLYVGWNSNVNFTGDGDVTTTGSMRSENSGSMYGTSPFNCSTGPCSGRNLCGPANTVTSSLLVGACSPTSSFTITANNPGGSSSYLWQSTTNLGNNSWSAASGTNTSANYTASSPSVVTYYRRRMITSTCTTYSKVVTVYGSAPAVPYATSTIFCSGTKATLTALGSPGTYQWYTSASGATAISGATGGNYTTPTTITSAVTYYVSAVVGNCESTPRVAVTVTPLAAPTVTPGSRCGGGTVVLSASGSGGSYQWYDSGSNSIWGATNATYTTNWLNSPSTTTYYVSLKSGSCETTKVPVTATVSNAPSQPTGVSGTTTICPNTSTVLTATGGGGTGYAWYTASSGGTLLSTSNPYTTPALSSATTYYVASTNGTCESSSRRSVSISMAATPGVPTGVTGTRTICSGSSTSLTATGGTGTGYRWYDASSGGTLLSSSNPYSTGVLTSSTTYYVARVNASGCESTTRYTVAVTVNTVAAPTAGSNSPVCRGSAINLTASTVSSATYAWTGPNSFTSSSQNPSLASATTAMGGTYNVTATVNGCTSAAGSVIVTVQECGNVWTGATSTSWTTGSNWLLGVVPVTTDSVTIPSGAVRMPILSSNQTLKALNVVSGASMTINDPSVLSLTSGLTVGGTLTNTGGTISFIGGTNQYINGNIVFNNLTVNGSGTVQVQTSVSVNGAITLTSGTIQSNGNLILNLDNGYIARGGSGSISGNMTVTRTISSNRTHYFSVPLDGATVADLTDDAEVFNSANGVSRLFQYYEPGNAWERITSPTAALIKGKGYSLYFLTPTVLDITGTYDHSYVHTVTLNNSNTNWKFVGNPYPGTIDWDAASGWTKTNLNNAVNYWEGSSGQYISYVAGAGTTAGGKTADRYIPAMNGFWLQTTGTGGTATLSMSSLVRVTNSKSFYREMDMSNVYSLVLSNGTQSDEAIIRFNDGSDPSFEGDLDAKKINNTGSIPSVASTMVGSTMAINTMPLLSTETIIPLYVKVGSNNAAYTLKWSNKNNPLYGTQFYLLDKKLGTSTALVEDELYTISQLTTDSTNRYELKLVSELTTPTPPTPNLTTGTQSALQSSVRVYAKDGKVYVEGIGSSTKEVEGDILTLGGTSIDRFSGVIGEGVSIQRTLSQVSSSMYLVRISSEGQQATYRVVMY